jgi:GT2 family glycosyltransferase
VSRATPARASGRLPARPRRVARRAGGHGARAHAAGFTNSPRIGFGALTIGVASANLAIARRAFAGVGGFDEQIEGRGDDSELGVRLWWYGYRVSILPQPVAFHLREPHGGTRRAGRACSPPVPRDALPAAAPAPLLTRAR